MTASRKSVDDLHSIIRRYTPPRLWRSLAKELRQVEGNRSLRETVAALAERLEKDGRPNRRLPCSHEKTSIEARNGTLTRYKCLDCGSTFEIDSGG